MTLSTIIPRRLVSIAVGALILVTLLAPLQAGAGFDTVDSGRGATTELSSEDAADGAGFNKRPCIDRDARSGDHHADDSTSATAEETEKGARKHARNGNHESAARAYEYAACLWDMISEFDKGTAAYEKAAEQYDKAAEGHEANGDKVRAEEARKNAERIRDYLK